MMKSRAPRRWVLSHTRSLESVHGVRMPIEKLRLARRSMRPTKTKSSPMAGSMAVLMRKPCTPRFQSSGQNVQVEQERHNEDDEEVERPAELGDVRFERINDRDQQEQTQHDQGDHRHEEGAPEARHGAVDLIGRVPMRGHLLRQLRVDRQAERSMPTAIMTRARMMVFREDMLDLLHCIRSGSETAHKAHPPARAGSLQPAGACPQVSTQTTQDHPQGCVEGEPRQAGVSRETWPGVLNGRCAICGRGLCPPRGVSRETCAAQGDAATPGPTERRTSACDAEVIHSFPQGLLVTVPRARRCRRAPQLTLECGCDLRVAEMQAARAGNVVCGELMQRGAARLAARGSGQYEGAAARLSGERAAVAPAGDRRVPPC